MQRHTLPPAKYLINTQQWGITCITSLCRRHRLLQISNSGRVIRNVCNTIAVESFFSFLDCSKLQQEASQKYSHCRGFLPFSSASQDNGSSLPEKSATGRRSFTSTWFPMPAAAPAAAESTQRASTASSSSSSFDQSSDTEPSSSTAGQLRSPTQRPGSSDQGQLETLYEGPPGSPTAFLKFNSPYKRKSKNISNNSNALLLIFGSSFFKIKKVTTFSRLPSGKAPRTFVVALNNLCKGSGVPHWKPCVIVGLSLEHLRQAVE